MATERHFSSGLKTFDCRYFKAKGLFSRKLHVKKSLGVGKSLVLC